MERNEPKFLGHPVGLYVCAGTELWERFSFYGMKFLLVLYLVKYHLFTDNAGLEVLGNYAGLVYAMPVIGGLLADRYLGMRKAVVFGGILLCLGHLGMAFEGHAAAEQAGVIVRDDTAIQVFYFSLALIITGVGFLKPNISTIVGRLYEEEDPRRDSGFTIFYMGINIGSFAATIICGYLGEKYGWKYGFGMAGIGMVAGLFLFLWGQKYLYGHADPSNPKVLKEKALGPINKEWAIYLGSIASLVLVWQLVQSHTWVKWALIGTSILFLVWLTYFLVKECDRVQAQRMIVLTVLTASTVVFWALFEQSSASMTLFADRVIDRVTVFGEVTASQLGSLNAMFIFMLAPFFAFLWIYLAKKKWEPSTPVKFGLGIVQVGIGFGALVIGAKMTGTDGAKVGMIFIVFAYLFHTTGELCLSPVGLSAVTKLSVDKVVGIMMGAWFLATAASEKVAAELSKIASIDTSGGEIADIGAAVVTYSDYFYRLFWVGVIVGIALLAISPLLRKGMHGVH
ncbi:MAG: peptide MFS transporter [Acidobacteria bacterium]|nr:peptide MFS transporter [Acidobacteriota bacterium]